MNSLFPYPEALEKISLMYGLNKFFASKRNLIGKSFSIASYINRMKNGNVYVLGTVVYDRLNMYFLNRSMHQANEDCNKLWSTLEVYHSVKEEED